MDDIGRQDGIAGFEGWLRLLADYQVRQNKWVDMFDAWASGPRDTQPPIAPKFPKIQLEGPNFNEADLNTWPWPRKFFRNTMRKLKDGFDAANPSSGGGTTDPPPPVTNPWDSGYAPRAYNSVGIGNEPSARFNVRINCIRLANGDYLDKNAVVYDSGGRDRGGRSFLKVAGLKPANEMDSREPWDPYEYGGTTIGPNKENYPADSYKQ